MKLFLNLWWVAPRLRLSFIHTMQSILTPFKTLSASLNKRGVWLEMSSQKYMIVWNNVHFHCSTSSDNGLRPKIVIMMAFLSPISSFFNPNENFFFSVWRWKIWPPATFTDDPSGCHECKMWWHHDRSLQRLYKHSKILSMLHGKRIYLLWGFVSQQTWTSAGGVCDNNLFVNKEQNQSDQTLQAHKQLTRHRDR